MPKCFPKVLVTFYRHSTSSGGFSTSLTILGVVSSSHFSHSHGCGGYLAGVLLCISLTYWVPFRLTCSSYIFAGECYSNLLYIKKKSGFVFLHCISRILCIFWIQGPYLLSASNDFLPVCGFSFYSLKPIFRRAEVFILMKSSWSVNYLKNCTFDIVRETLIYFSQFIFIPSLLFLLQLCWEVDI